MQYPLRTRVFFILPLAGLMCSVALAAKSHSEHEFPESDAGDKLVRYRPSVYDTDGFEVQTLQPFTGYELVVTVEDLRIDPNGVFAAFFDLHFNPEQASFEQESKPLAFGFGVDGPTDDTPNSPQQNAAGHLMHRGGISGIEPLGGGEMGVVSLHFETLADPTGLGFHLSCPPNQVQHPTLIFGSDDVVSCHAVDFGSFGEGSLADFLTFDELAAMQPKPDPLLSDPDVRFYPYTISQIYRRGDSLSDSALLVPEPDLTSWWGLWIALFLFARRASFLR